MGLHVLKLYLHRVVGILLERHRAVLSCFRLNKLVDVVRHLVEIDGRLLAKDVIGRLWTDLVVDQVFDGVAVFRIIAASVPSR